MNALTPIEQSAETPDIVALFEATPSIVLLDEKKAGEFYDACVAEVEAHVPDLTTEKGRKAIASLAFKIRTRKASIDRARLALTKNWRDQTASVNAAGKDAEAKYEALEATARKPLTDWEAEEQAKKDRIKAAFDYLQNAPVVLAADTSDTLTGRLAEVRAYLLPNDFEPEHRDGCERLRATAIAALTTAIAEAQQKEQDARDLAAFRASQAVAPQVAAAPAPALAEPAPAVPPVASADAPTAVPATPPEPATEDQTLVILGRAKADLMEVCGLDEATARRVALALGRGQIRHFTVTLENFNAG